MKEYKENEDPYNDSISESMEDSIAKALQIMERQFNAKKRMLYRPKVSLAKGIAPVLIYIICCILLFAFSADISRIIGVSIVWTRCIIIVLMLLIFVLCLKPFVLWLIKIYQRYAPDNVRASCVFEPSCSNYMAESIKKYGVIKGIYRGFKRLGRCHPPNGGVDEP